MLSAGELSVGVAGTSLGPQCAMVGIDACSWSWNDGGVPSGYVTERRASTWADGRETNKSNQQSQTVRAVATIEQASLHASDSGSKEARRVLHLASMSNIEQRQ